MHILITGAYRLFFPVAGLFAALVIPIWLLLYSGVDLALPADGLRWHRHEMLFGYLSLALGGFLLTAIPNWTGRAALRGAPLVGLLALWLAGRAGLALMPAGALQAALALGFPVALAALASREIWAGGNRRNLPVAALVWLFAGADALFLAGHEALAQRAGFGLALILITLVGGRVTPAFSRNWLKARGHTPGIPVFGRFDAVAMGAAIAAVLGWIVLPDQLVTGGLALLAAVLLALRLARWKAWSVAAEPLLLALHMGYAWLPVSFALIAAQTLGSGVDEIQVAHAVGAGAVGGMTMIVMIRAVLGHANRPIAGNGLDVAILGAVHLGAALRVIAPVFGDPMLPIHLSGAIWALGFAGFFLRYGRIALLPRQ
ncbi:NnrS family protein [Sedimentitalea sp. HM32M-2]|uniref:NnrS family protein n=1 Tax=Sedimentitalea sp. HM32M-2 TaxID=3351566 RepID=UPI00363A09C0